MSLPRCRSCGRDLDRGPHEGYALFLRRRICSMTGCTGKGEIQPDYPGAIPAAAVPPRCGRCRGLWRRIPDGVRCLTCGRGQAVVEALLRLAGVGGDATD